MTCPWPIQVASGNPEPDSPEDCWVEVECGAPLHDDPPDGQRCEAGHEFGNLQRRWAPGGSEWQREQQERRGGF